MNWTVKLKQWALLLGDIVVLYASLLVTLSLRYRGLPSANFDIHFWPFTIIFIIWLIAFYIGGLYDIKDLKNDLRFAGRFLYLLVFNGILATLLFYFVPVFGITPRANLFIVVLIFGLAAYFWRTFYNNLLAAGGPTNRILLVGYNKTAEEVAAMIQQNPQLGYEVSFWMKEGLQDKELDHLSQIILSNKINLIVVPAHIKKSPKAARLIYKNLALGMEVMDLAQLYEIVFQKIPLAELEEVWFLENLSKSHAVYDFFKKGLDVFLAIAVGVILLPIALIISALIAATSPGPALYSQKRVGEREKEFTIYKFRTMRMDAEKEGPKWAVPNDARITPIGKFLRKTHLDELPQLLNVILGNLSFVGPRPERPEFVSAIRKEVPFFELRLLGRPGITGWAQINYKYGASVEEMHEKLQYDIYYLKNRSLALDFLILLRTIKYIFTSHK